MVGVVVATDEKDTMEIMRKRVDRLMKAIQVEMKDENLRFELITKLVGVRELLNEEDN